MVDTYINITVPAGLDVTITCYGCRLRNLGSFMCDKQEEGVDGLYGTTYDVKSDPTQAAYLRCSVTNKQAAGNCVGMKNIQWSLNENATEENVWDTEWFCPVEQITSGWSRVEYTVEGNELRMSDATKE
jgi:hypothetical protein